MLFPPEGSPLATCRRTSLFLLALSVGIFGICRPPSRYERSFFIPGVFPHKNGRDRSDQVRCAAAVHEDTGRWGAGPPYPCIWSARLQARLRDPARQFDVHEGVSQLNRNRRASVPHDKPGEAAGFARLRRTVRPRPQHPIQRRADGPDLRPRQRELGEHGHRIIPPDVSSSYSITKGPLTIRCVQQASDSGEPVSRLQSKQCR
jgi:hypothetical protein